MTYKIQSPNVKSPIGRLLAYSTLVLGISGLVLSTYNLTNTVRVISLKKQYIKEATKVASLTYSSGYLNAVYAMGKLYKDAKMLDRLDSAYKSDSLIHDQMLQKTTNQ